MGLGFAHYLETRVDSVANPSRFAQEGHLSLIQAIGIPVSLTLIVVAVMKRVHYGLALLIGTVTLGLFSQLSPQQFAEVFTAALTDTTTFDLMLIVTLIPILAHCMKEAGMLDNLIKSAKGILSSRAFLMFLPALMGALPMPGGALLSAPLIDDEAKRLNLSREETSFINVWFREWMNFIHPLSSPLILAASLTGVSLYSLILIQFPAVLLYLLLGYFVSIRKIADEGEGEKQRDAKTLLSILVNMSPIVLVVLLNILGMDMGIALAIGVAFVFVVGRVRPRRAVVLLRQGFDWRLPLAMIGIMCFRYMMKSSGAVLTVLPNIEATGLPTTFLLIAMAWTVGLTTAMPAAGIAIIIPIAVVMTGNLSLSLTSLIYLTMIFAYIISPTHLCLILTVEYYKARLLTVYRKMIPTVVTAYLTSLAFASIMPKW